MATFALIDYKDASPEVRAIYDDIMATRKIDWINNFWKAIAHDPATLKRTWESLKEIMGPGALDPLTKELLYVAVSASNGCRYCIASHGAAARRKGMTEAQYSELLAIVGLAAACVVVSRHYPLFRFAAPLAALFATVLAFNQLGDGLRRALDPVLRR